MYLDRYSIARFCTAASLLINHKIKRIETAYVLLVPTGSVGGGYQMKEEERRRSIRYRVRGSITFTGDDLGGSGQFYNISATGCAVETPCHVPLQSQLRISLPMKDEEPIIIDTAVVRWAHHDTFGVEFLLADTTHVTKLGACLNGLSKSDSSAT